MNYSSNESEEMKKIKDMLKGYIDENPEREQAKKLSYHIPFQNPTNQEYANVRLWQIIFNTGYFESMYHENLPRGFVRFTDKYHGGDYLNIPKEIMEEIRKTRIYKDGWKQCTENAERVFS